MSLNKEKQLGQFFTPVLLAELMLELASKQNTCKVLEPSCGMGVFLELLEKQNFVNVDSYEIDKTVINPKFNVFNESFVSASFKSNKKYDLIIGNPPYVRWKNLSEKQKEELLNNETWSKHFNSLCDILMFFIYQSIEMLEDDGELIFITTDTWARTSHAQFLREHIVKQGRIDTWIEFKETKIFPKVTSSMVVFKFVKNKQKNTIGYFKFKENKITDKTLNLQNKKQFEHYKINHFKENEKWFFVDDLTNQTINNLEKACRNQTLKNHSQIANGMVSGLDKAFKIDSEKEHKFKSKETIDVLKAKDIGYADYNTTTKYLFLENVDNENTLKINHSEAYNHLQSFRKELEKRYDYKKGARYWHWSLLRSYKFLKETQPLIFVPCKERITNKNRLRFTVAPENTFPTQDVAAIHVKNIEAEYVVALLTSKQWYQWIANKGLVKGGLVEFTEKPLENIPILIIDENDKTQKEIKNQLIQFVKTKQTKYQQLDNLVEELIKIRNK